MRRLLPDPVDPIDLDAALADVRDAPPGRPWTIGLGVATADGAASLGGVSGDLGGAGDRKMFVAVRDLGDAIVVGAGTARAERYGPARSPHPARRTARGQAPHPRLVVVSARLSVGADLPLFTTDASSPLPIVAHRDDLDEDTTAYAGRAELLPCPAGPDQGIDIAALLDRLAAGGVRTVVVEGGPRLSGAFVRDDLLDEMSLTLDPRVVGGDGPRIVRGDGDGHDRPWEGRALLEEEGVLFWRLRRLRDVGGSA